MALFESIKEFIVQLTPGCALIGLDLGDKTIGIALSDWLHTIATPYQTIQRKTFKRDIDALNIIITATNAGGIVLGLPINMIGTQGVRCQKTRSFARNLSHHYSLPIIFWDERLSSIAANRVLLQANMSRAKRKKVINHIAAAYILQGFLDRITYMKNDAKNQYG